LNSTARAIGVKSSDGKQSTILEMSLVATSRFTSSNGYQISSSTIEGEDNEPLSATQFPIILRYCLRSASGMLTSPKFCST
jgi:hypothetical protein